MSNNSRSFVEYLVHDLLFPLGNVTSRVMFGGHGIYCQGKIFAIIVDNELYLKVYSGNQADFEEAGSKPFTYRKKNGDTVSMSYWKVPTHILDDPVQIIEWCRKTLQFYNKP